MDPFAANTSNSGMDPFGSECKTAWKPHPFRASFDSIMDEEPAVERSVVMRGSVRGEVGVMGMGPTPNQPKHKQLHFWDSPMSQQHQKTKLSSLPTHIPIAAAPEIKPLQPPPSYFDSTHSFYSNTNHVNLLRDVDVALSKDNSVKSSRDDTQISGFVYSDRGQTCVFVTNVFHDPAKDCVIMEWRKTHGCSFLFSDFFCRLTSNALIKQHISEFCGTVPQPVESLLDLDLPDFGDGFLGDDFGFGQSLGPAEEITRSTALLKSEFIDDQRDASQSLLLLSCNVQETEVLMQLVDVVAEYSLIQSCDCTVARHACEMVDNICKSERAPAAVRAQVGQKLMGQVSAMLNSPETMSMWKCKSHLVSALENMTLSFKDIPQDLTSLLCEFSRHSEFGESITKTLTQVGVSSQAPAAPKNLDDMW